MNVRIIRDVRVIGVIRLSLSYDHDDDSDDDSDDDDDHGED